MVGHDVSRSAVGLALNPQHARSQDQLHIHIECVRADVAAALQAAAPRITDSWSPIVILGSDYLALKIMGEELGGSNPFHLLADKFLAAKSAAERAVHRRLHSHRGRHGLRAGTRLRRTGGQGSGGRAAVGFDLCESLEFALNSRGGITQ